MFERIIQYYQRKTGQEIDFIFKGNTAPEIIETPLEQKKISPSTSN
jgi:predicted AAA+ superfamily ATPase